MWRSQTKHLTSYQWVRENNWVSGKLSRFSQEFLCFYSKSSLSTRATHTRKRTTSQNQTFFLSIILSLHSPTYMVLFSVLCSFYTSFVSTATLFESTVMFCFSGIGLARKDGTGLFGIFLLWIEVVIQGFLEQFIAACYMYWRIEFTVMLSNRHIFYHFFCEHQLH